MPLVEKIWRNMNKMTITMLQRPTASKTCSNICLVSQTPDATKAYCHIGEWFGWTGDFIWSMTNLVD